jgi:hypothetical protein
VEVRGDRATAALGEVAAGTYALYVRAWEPDCELYAVGCQAHHVEGGEQATLLVIASEIDPRPCGPSERCEDGRCLPPESLDAAAPTDAGPPVDASTLFDAAPPDAAVPVECPDDYDEIDGSRYRFVPRAAAWLDAERDCEDDALGAHLIVVDDVDEHYVLHSLSGRMPDSWIGYTDRVDEGQLLWLGPGGLRPDDSECFWGLAGVDNGASRDCVAQDSFNTCGDWFVRSCDDLRAYVCECDDHPANRDAY